MLSPSTDRRYCLEVALLVLTGLDSDNYLNVKTPVDSFGFGEGTTFYDPIWVFLLRVFIDAREIVPTWLANRPKGDLMSSDRVEGVRILLGTDFSFVWLGDTNFVVISLPSFTMIHFFVFVSFIPFRFILKGSSCLMVNLSDGIYFKIGKRKVMLKGPDYFIILLISERSSESSGNSSDSW